MYSKRVIMYVELRTSFVMEGQTMWSRSFWILIIIVAALFATLMALGATDSPRFAFTVMFVLAGLIVVFVFFKKPGRSNRSGRGIHQPDESLLMVFASRRPRSGAGNSLPMDISGGSESPGAGHYVGSDRGRRRRG